MLRIAYKDYKSFLAAHYRIVQKLAIELYEVKNELCPKIMLIFKDGTHQYNLKNSLICDS